MDLAYLSGYYRIGDYSAVSGSLRYFSLGEVTANGSAAMTIKPYELSADVAYSLMLSEKFSLGAAVRWIYSDLTYDFNEETSPGSAFAADISAYYQNYINIGSRECQLGLGLNISNIGSKITFGGDNRSEFIPTNLRLGASLMIPVDEFNRFTIAADANKLLVPTYPKRRSDESEVDYQDRLQKEYYDVSSISVTFILTFVVVTGTQRELVVIHIFCSNAPVYLLKFFFCTTRSIAKALENARNRRYIVVFLLQTVLIIYFRLI